MHFARLLVASALAAFASAQSSSITAVASSTVSQSMPAVATAGFNAALIDTQTKFSWCLGQRNNCPLICGGTTNENYCDPMTLTYSCICSNGTSPDVSAFTETLPFYICEATFAQCLNNTPSTNPQGQAQCMADHECGTRNASSLAASTSSAASSGSASRTSSAASGTSSAAAATSSASSAAMTTYTSGLFAAVLMAVMKMLL